ncbi:MAG: lipoyl synthase [Gammaproteobacteria bacterium]|jgi:lipoyl synthase|nr:lipoyl synthase [Gammaproteobacteria bacterium]MBT5203091.1 lipoyl synthase [Gammaproteobacteria bacterium]MBT5602741.1 lipoyl synthase [Gammaproteobacteria bacterium]MBT6247076.1 lipoyl synthase [Gammaproteobacteria bacterium]
MDSRKRNRLIQGEKLRGADKLRRIPVKVVPSTVVKRKPDWLRIRISADPKVARIKEILRKRKLASVCEEASCPNLSECFAHGTATFMIMGEICTRRCPFCDVAHGKPNPLDPAEPQQLAEAVEEMKLSYVVVTSVDRDDLKDSGAAHFADCIRAVRELNPNTEIEVLVPDFRGRMDIALNILQQTPPHVFNHNLETVPRLYKQARPGADYAWSLELLKQYKQLQPKVITKSGLMLGLGEEMSEVEEVMADLREHSVDMLTLGQYLQPSKDHLAVARFVHPDEFSQLGQMARKMGFSKVASGPLVRSSYHADLQAKGDLY